MIKLIIKTNVDGDNSYHYQFSGLSTDTKPTEYGGQNVEVNSLFLELDTNKVYYLSEEGWAEVGKSGGSALVPEQTFTGSETGYGYYSTYLVTDTYVTSETIKVVFDGTEYTCSISNIAEGEYEYGAPYDGGTSYDFSEYPFNLYSSTGSTYEECLQVNVADGDEHTITIYEA